MEESIDHRQRALLVNEVFGEYVEAYLALTAVLEQCAIKGWPDRQDAIRVASRLQELRLKRLLIRLSYFAQLAWDETDWSSLTRTVFIYARVQDRWTVDNEIALGSMDAEYVEIQSAVEEMAATADTSALEEAYRTARKDPELIAAAWEFDGKVKALDSRLSTAPVA